MPGASPTVRYGSVCSGIEAATVAWHPLGWEAAWFSEIEPFPKAVLAHRWPGVPDLGDFTKIGADRGPVDVLVGGTPCQSFSVAGLRGGMADARGNLALEFLRLAARLHARWVVWENVPGVLSSNGGRDFGSFLGGLGELGYGYAYRVLDAQFFGVAQRRRRVFVVGHAGGQWQRAAAVLFERACLRGDPPPRREKGTRAPRRAQVRADGSFAPVAFPANFSNQGMEENLSPTLAAERPTAAMALSEDLSGTLDAEGQRCGNRGQGVLASMSVRRVTPRECERLQGLPDDYTAIPGAKDGPRYRALGNSMAVPVMRWLGQRIQMVEDAIRRAEEAA